MESQSSAGEESVGDGWREHVSPLFTASLTHIFIASRVGYVMALALSTDHRHAIVAGRGCKRASTPRIIRDAARALRAILTPRPSLTRSAPSRRLE